MGLVKNPKFRRCLHPEFQEKGVVKRKALLACADLICAATDDGLVTPGRINVEMGHAQRLLHSLSLPLWKGELSSDTNLEL